MLIFNRQLDFAAIKCNFEKNDEFQDVSLELIGGHLLPPGVIYFIALENY